MLNSSDTVNRTLTMNFSDLNKTNETFHSNSSVITCNSQDILSYDPLFHIACVIFLVSYLLPTSLLWAKMSYHSGLMIGHLSLGVLSWSFSCASEIMFWHGGFILINIVQIISALYMARENKFEQDVENVFIKLFEPFKITRSEFSCLLNSNIATVASLHPGECYAVSGLTKADKLGLLLSGRCSVLNESAFLHNIDTTEFLDSPEFEGNSSNSDSCLFQVTICAAIPSKYIMWQRNNLEYLFVKHPKLANVITALISRDVNNKILSMTQRMEKRTGVVVDIRLPPLMSRLMITNGSVPDVYKSMLRPRETRDLNPHKNVTLTRDRSRRLATIDGDTRNHVMIDNVKSQSASSLSEDECEQKVMTKL